MSESLKFLVSLLDLEPIEVNIFRGAQLDEERQRVFGGQVAGQALMAAGRTVEHGRVHSLHSYFLRPGDPTVPILYEVDRIRDGRSFTTRRVVAIQHGRAIYNMEASFHDLEESSIDAPVRDARGTRPRVAADAVGTAPALPGGAGRVVREAASDRPAPHRRAALAQQGRRGGPYHRLWIRADGELPDDPLLHACVDHLRVGHVALRHRPDAAHGELGRPGLHGGQPGPLHVVPPTRSGPTTGCSTTWTRRRRPAAAAWPAVFSTTGRASSAYRWPRRAWPA